MLSQLVSFEAQWRPVYNPMERARQIPLQSAPVDVKYQIGTFSSKAGILKLTIKRTMLTTEMINTPNASEVTLLGRRSDFKGDLPHLFTRLKSLLRFSCFLKWE